MNTATSCLPLWSFESAPPLISHARQRENRATAAARSPVDPHLSIQPNREAHMEPIEDEYVNRDARPVSEVQSLLTFYKDRATSLISDCLGRMHGAVGLVPWHRDSRLAGTAYTVRVRAGDNLFIHEALRRARPGDVLIVDGGGAIAQGYVGAIMKEVAKSRGIAGFVIDGAIRDVAAFRLDTFPCYARAVSHRGPFKSGPGQLEAPVCIGGMVVYPGDIVIGDEDGVVAIPIAQASRIKDAVLKKELHEEEILRSIADGEYDDSWIDEALARAHT
jgi:regulator of RNase E activity RraA